MLVLILERFGRWALWRDLVYFQDMHMPTRLATLRYDRWQEPVHLINVFKCSVTPFSSKGPEWRRHMKNSHTCPRYLVVECQANMLCSAVVLSFLHVWVSPHSQSCSQTTIHGPVCTVLLLSVSRSRALHRDQSNMSYSND